MRALLSTTFRTIVMLRSIAPRALPFFLLFSLLCAASCAQPRLSGKKLSGSTARVVYVALGDSTGVGLGARNGGGYVERLFGRIRQARPGSRLVNLSEAGATTADVLDKQLAHFGGTGATFVSVCIGMNDLMRGTDEQQFARNYEEIVTRLRKAGVAVVVTNLPDITLAPAASGQDHAALGERLENYNSRIEELAGRYDLPLADLHRESLGAFRSRPGLFSADGLHPSDAGYESWAEAMWPATLEALD